MVLEGHFTQQFARSTSFGGNEQDETVPVPQLLKKAVSSPEYHNKKPDRTVFDMFTPIVIAFVLVAY